MVSGSYHGKCDRSALASLGLKVGSVKWQPDDNRGYCDSDCRWRGTRHAEHTYWAGALEDGQVRGAAYYCPHGWYRHAVKPASSVQHECFQHPWKLMYHGTTASCVHQILRYVAEGKQRCGRVGSVRTLVVLTACVVTPAVGLRVSERQQGIQSSGKY